MSRDWVAWHDHYDEANSPLSRRLGVVQSMLRRLLAGPKPASILTLCAGSGADLLPVLAEVSVPHRAVLVELDPELCDRARLAAANLGLADRVEVIEGDAGASATWASRLPVDLLMLCGVFGNVPTSDVRRSVEAVPAMVSGGGEVIWTRHGRGDDDLRPVVRGWFADVGVEEIAWHGDPDAFGVGVGRVPAGGLAGSLPDRLFAFAD